jgi:RNA polymerase sigma-70 factor, ECF subfamily
VCSGLSVTKLQIEEVVTLEVDSTLYKRVARDTARLNLTQSSSLSDEEVVARVRAGDTALYEVLMRRYNQRLFRIARAVLLDNDEAEDLVQDTYVRAYASLHQFAGKAKFSTWPAKIAVHEALARSRKRKRIEDAPAGADQESRSMETMKSSDPDPEQQTLRQEALSFLEQAVDRLPGRYRSVFVLREIEDMSTAETANCLDLTEEAVKVRLLRARQTLRQELYALAGAVSCQAFQFLGWRCDRVVRRVFDRLEASNKLASDRSEP